MEEPYVEIQEAVKVRRIVLGNDPLTIGRRSDNRLILTDNLCSRFHCLIGKGRGGFTLRDLNSSNGTALNGRITKFSKLAGSENERRPIIDGFGCRTRVEPRSLQGPLANKTADAGRLASAHPRLDASLLSPIPFESELPPVDECLPAAGIYEEGACFG